MEQSSLPVTSSSASISSEGLDIEKSVYTNEKYHFSFQYPSDRQIFDEGTSGLAASLSILIIKKQEAIDDADAVSVRIYERPNWSENDGWIHDNNGISKVITDGDYLAQIYRGADGDMATMNLVKSTFQFQK
jgi:hypothetical protein